MEFNNINEAFEYLQQFEILNNLYYEPLGKQIKQVFIGISDIGVSKAIYLGLFDIFPKHHFTKSDLSNIFIYAGFFPTLDMNDSVIIRIDEMFKNEPEFLDYVEKGKIETSVIVTQKASEPIKIPKGLGIRMTFKGDSKFEFKISDPITARQSSGAINPKDNDFYLIGYSDYSHELSNMIRPLIFFNLVYSDEPPVEIFLEFLHR